MGTSFFNNFNKTFLDFLANIPSLVLKIILGLLYVFIFNETIFLEIINIFNEYKIEFIIISIALMYPINIIFSFLSIPYKNSTNESHFLELYKKKPKDIYKNIKGLYGEKPNKEKLKDENKLIKPIKLSLLDISNYIGYSTPMFFENKIRLFKSIKNTFIVFVYINIILLVCYICGNNSINLFFSLFSLLIYISVIFILNKEIEEYKKGYNLSLLNINYFLELRKTNEK